MKFGHKAAAVAVTVLLGSTAASAQNATDSKGNANGLQGVRNAAVWTGAACPRRAVRRKA